jgi:mRNA-degrading endonuclease RelE of RelBE toxin-antitoxin system
MVGGHAGPPLQKTKANPGAKKLARGERYGIRVGDYRVLYTIDDALQKIEVSAMGHRREVYRQD